MGTLLGSGLEKRGGTWPSTNGRRHPTWWWCDRLRRRRWRLVALSASQHLRPLAHSHDDDDDARAKKEKKKEKKTAQGHKYIICRRAIFHSHNQRPKSDTKIRDTFLLLKDFRFKNKFKKTNRWRLVSVSVCSDVKNDFQLLVAEGEQTVDVQLSMAVNWFFSPNMTDDTPCLYAMKRCLKTLFEGSHSVDLSWRDKPHKKEAEREREKELRDWFVFINTPQSRQILAHSEYKLFNASIQFRIYLFIYFFKHDAAAAYSSSFCCCCCSIYIFFQKRYIKNCFDSHFNIKSHTTPSVDAA